MIPEKDLTEDLPVNPLTRDANMIVLSKIDALLQTHPNSPNYSLSIHNGHVELVELVEVQQAGCGRNTWPFIPTQRVGTLGSVDHDKVLRSWSDYQ